MYAVTVQGRNSQMTKLEVGHLILGGGEEDRSSGHRILNIKECEHVRMKISLEANAKVLNCFVLHPTTSYKIEQTRNTY